MIKQLREYEITVGYLQKLESSDITHLQSLKKGHEKFMEVLAPYLEELPVQKRDRAKVLCEQWSKRLGEVTDKLCARKFELLDRVGSHNSLFNGAYNTFLPETFFAYASLEGGVFVTFKLMGAAPILENASKMIIKGIYEQFADYVMDLGDGAFGFCAQQPNEPLAWLADKIGSFRSQNPQEAKTLLLHADYLRLPFMPHSHPTFLHVAQLGLSEVADGAHRPGEYQLHWLQEWGQEGGARPKSENPALAKKFDSSILVISKERVVAETIATNLARELKLKVLRPSDSGEIEPGLQGKVFCYLTEKSLNDALFSMRQGGLKVNERIKRVICDTDLFEGISVMHLANQLREELGYTGTLVFLLRTQTISVALQKLIDQHKIQAIPIKEMMKTPS